MVVYACSCLNIKIFADAIKLQGMMMILMMMMMMMMMIAINDYGGGSNKNDHNKEYSDDVDGDDNTKFIFVLT
jgi:hypothetical protein